MLRQAGYRVATHLARSPAEFTGRFEQCFDLVAGTLDVKSQPAEFLLKLYHLKLRCVVQIGNQRFKAFTQLEIMSYQPSPHQKQKRSPMRDRRTSPAVRNHSGHRSKIARSFSRDIRPIPLNLYGLIRVLSFFIAVPPTSPVYGCILDRKSSTKSPPRFSCRQSPRARSHLRSPLPARTPAANR